MQRYLFLISVFVFVLSPVRGFGQSNSYSSTDPKDMVPFKPSKVTGKDIVDLWSSVGGGAHGAGTTDSDIFERYKRYEQYDMETILRWLRSGENRFGQTFARQIRGFPAEALVFYTAIGASMVVQAYTDSLTKGGRADPNWMESLMSELTSPVGVFSFLCFVIAMGQTHTLYSKWMIQGFGPFNKGPLKGKKINPVVSKSRLDALRRQAQLSEATIPLKPNKAGVYTPEKSIIPPKAKMKYLAASKSARWGMFLGGPLGMSVGMMASNMVHELHYIFSYNPHFAPCRDYLMGRGGSATLAGGSATLAGGSAGGTASPKRVGDMHCDAFYDGLGATVISWAPGLASLVTASFLSHFLLSGLYSGIGKTAQLSRGFIQRAGMKAGIRVSLSFLMNWFAFIPAGGPATATTIKTMSKAREGVKAGASWLLKQIQPGGRGYMFVHLLSFLLTETYVTHGFFNWLMTEPMKANELSDRIKNFTQYNNKDMSSENFISKNYCTEKENPNCEFHPSILSLHKTALSFDRWRQFRMQKAMMAHQNWFSYIYNATGSFDMVRNTYKEFFKTKFDQSSPLDSISYFGPLADPNNSVLQAFTNMRDQIDNYVRQNNIPQPTTLNLNVVSASDSYFIKPEKELNIKLEERIFVLRELFNSVDDGSVPLQNFYGTEWDKAFETEKNRFQNNIKEQCSEFYVGSLYVGSLEECIYRAIEILNPLSANEKETREEKCSEYYSGSLKECEQKAIEIWLAGVGGYLNWLGGLEKSNYSLTIEEDTNFVDQVTNFILRKRMWSAGVEYLNRIVELEKTKNRYGHRLTVDEVNNFIKNNNNYNFEKQPPSAVLSTFQKLGTDNIFAQLYAKTFILDEDSQEVSYFHFTPSISAKGMQNVSNRQFDKKIDENQEVLYYQISPSAKGTEVVYGYNQLYTKYEKNYNINYHPDRLKNLKTNGMIDFIVASAVCGPDLNTEPELMLNQVEDTKDLMSQLSVFDKPVAGTSFAFHPPHITMGINEKDRANICYWMSTNNRKDIYNSRFVVEGREYSNLLHLVLDHVHLQGVYSLEDFDNWWLHNVEPYKAQFLTIANKEHSNIIQHDFMSPLFQEDVKETQINSLIVSDSSELEESKKSKLENLSRLSLDQFEFKKISRFDDSDWIGGELDFFLDTRYKKYNLNLPKGVFKNMYFEALYWSDVILHYAEKEFANISEEEKKQIENNLIQFARVFNPAEVLPLPKTVSENEVSVEVSDLFFINPENSYDTISAENESLLMNRLLDFKDFSKSGCSNTTFLIEENNPCQSWANDFVKPEKLKFFKTLLRRRVAEPLHITMSSAENEFAGLSEEQWKKVQREQIAQFYQTDSIYSQIIRYSVLRLDQLLTEAMNYANYVKSISDHPDGEQVTNTPPF